MSNEWRCPKCGRVEREYRIICGNYHCGYRKSFLRWILDYHKQAYLILMSIVLLVILLEVFL